MSTPEGHPQPFAHILDSLTPGSYGVRKVTDILVSPESKIPQVTLLGALPGSGKSTLITAIREIISEDTMEIVTFEDALKPIRSERPDPTTYYTDPRYDTKYLQFYRHGSQNLEGMAKRSILHAQGTSQRIFMVAPVFTGRVEIDKEGNEVIIGVDSGSSFAYRLAKRIGGFENLAYDLSAIALFSDSELDGLTEFVRESAKNDAATKVEEEFTDLGLHKEDLEETRKGGNAPPAVIRMYRAWLMQLTTGLVENKSLGPQTVSTPQYIRDEFFPYYLGPTYLDFDPGRVLATINTILPARRDSVDKVA